LAQEGLRFDIPPDRDWVESDQSASDHNIDTILSDSFLDVYTRQEALEKQAQFQRL